MQRRIRSMALCHELLYQSENLASIKTTQYMGNLLSQLMESFLYHGQED